MKFCSQCASNQLEKITPLGDNRPRLVCTNCQTIHYSNPKIVTGCLPVWGDKVLLAKRSIEPRSGYWNIPAGYMENKESVEEGAIREVWEETEARVKNLKVLTVYSIPRISQVYILFKADLIDGQFGIGEESLEVRLFTEAEIPWDDIAFPSSTFALQQFFSDRKKGHFTTHLGRMDW